MAVVCRSVCGVIVLAAQRRAFCVGGEATARSSRCPTPERVSRGPARLGKTGASGCGR